LARPILDQANVPIDSIQKILGHKNRTTTEIYLHTIGNAEKDAMVMLDLQFEQESHTDSHTEAKKVFDRLLLNRIVVKIATDPVWGGMKNFKIPYLHAEVKFYLG